MERRCLFGLLLLAAAHAEDVVGSTSQGEGCESHLESVKTELKDAVQSLPQGSAIQLNWFFGGDGGSPVGAPPQGVVAKGDPHWPADHSSYVPPLELYFQELVSQLRGMKDQYIPAVVAFLFGLINVINGPASFKTIVLAAVALVAAGSARYEVALVWPDLNMQQQLGVAVEVGLVMAFVVHKSFEGAKMVLGLLLGLGVSAVLENFVHTEYWSLTASLTWYSFFAFAGVFSLTVGQRHVLALLTPFLGGFLCASSLGFLVKYMLEQNFQGGHAPTWFEPRGDTYLDFARALLGQDVAAGSIKPYPTPGFPIDRVNFDLTLGLLFWFVLFFAGSKRQMRLARQNAADQIISLTESFVGAQQADKYSRNEGLWGA